MEPIWPPEQPEETLSLVRRRAKRLVGKANLPPTEVDEIAQHIEVELWKQSGQFDPAKGQWLDFVRARSFQVGSKYLRHTYAGKRDRRRCQSLHDPVLEPDGHVVELVETISDRQLRKHRYYQSKGDGLDVQDEYRRLIQQSPPELRDTLYMLSNGTVSSVAKSIGMSRTTLNSKLKKLRKSITGKIRT